MTPENNDKIILSQNKKYTSFPQSTIPQSSFPTIIKTFFNKIKNKDYIPKISTDPHYAKVLPNQSPDNISKEDFDLKEVYEAYFGIIRYKRYLIDKSKEIKSEIIKQDDIILEEKDRRNKILNKDILERIWRIDDYFSEILDLLNKIINKSEIGWNYVRKIKRITEKKIKNEY